MAMFLSGFYLLSSLLSQVPALQTSTTVALSSSSSSPFLLSSPSSPSFDPNAVGLLEVFPFKDTKRNIRCTAFHVGNGYVVTAGHCFLGALSCNRAKVWFGLRGDQQARLPSLCTQVLWNQATEQDNDIAVFKVDFPPQAALTLAPFAKTRTAFHIDETVTQLSYDASLTLQRYDDCQIKQGPIVDAFGRLRRNDANTLSASCRTGLYGHGAPLISAAGTVFGIQQAPLFSPSVDETENRNTILQMFVSTTSQISNAIATRSFPLPKSIYLGNFAPEAFPNAIRDQLQLHVITITNETESGYLAARFAAAPTSTFFVKDARGQTMTFSGLQDEKSQQSIQLFPPVDIQLHTGKKVYSINDAVHFSF